MTVMTFDGKTFEVDDDIAALVHALNTAAGTACAQGASALQMAESYSCSRAMRSPNGSTHSFLETSMVKRLMSEQRCFLR